jgi:hypothetical protein
MLRRTYLRALTGLSALPFVPDCLDPTPERLPADGQLVFGYHFRQAVVTDQGMTTERSQETVVEDQELSRCSRNDAKRALELAHSVLSRHRPR